MNDKERLLLFLFLLLYFEKLRFSQEASAKVEDG